jgi:hypothetical protein
VNSRGKFTNNTKIKNPIEVFYFNEILTQSLHDDKKNYIFKCFGEKSKYCIKLVFYSFNSLIFLNLSASKKIIL